jgi:hypothetical protein
VEARSAALGAKHAAATRTMDALRATVADIFRETGCDTAATRELLGDSGVNESNVLQYLALIEQRCSEIMPLYAEHVAGREATPPPVQAEPSEARSYLTQQVRAVISSKRVMAHRARAPGARGNACLAGLRGQHRPPLRCRRL